MSYHTSTFGLPRFHPWIINVYWCFSVIGCHGIGSVLSQIQDGIEKQIACARRQLKPEKPIAYAMRQLKPVEGKYATVEKSSLAVLFSIKHFRHYLIDKLFTVISDHRPLQWLENQKDNNGRLERWAILIAGTNYQTRERLWQKAECMAIFRR